MFVAKPRFKRAAICTAVSMLPEQDIADSRELFLRLDLDGDGTVSAQDLKKVPGRVETSSRRAEMGGVAMAGFMHKAFGECFDFGSNKDATSNRCIASSNRCLTTSNKVRY